MVWRINETTGEFEDTTYSGLLAVREEELRERRLRDPSDQILDQARDNPAAESLVNLSDKPDVAQEDKERIRIEIEPAREYLEFRKEIADQLEVLLEQAERESFKVPETERFAKRNFGDIKPTFGRKLGTGVNTLFRIVNFTAAMESGAIIGLIRSLRNEGSVLDAMNEIQRSQKDQFENILGFERALAEAGIPEGKKFRLHRPVVQPGLRHFAQTIDREGIVLGPEFGGKENLERLRNGKFVDADWKPFGPIMTTRGAAGLFLDIFAVPETWMSFGANTPLKLAVQPVKGIFGRATQKATQAALKKAGFKNLSEAKQAIRDFEKGTKKTRRKSPIKKLAKDERTLLKRVTEEGAETGARSVARFAGKTLLTDFEFRRGLKAMRQTKLGHELAHVLDEFAAVNVPFLNISTREAAIRMGRALSPTFAGSKPMYRMIRRGQDASNRLLANASKVFDDVFRNWTDEQKIEFFTKLNTAAKRERDIGKGKVPRVQFEDKALQNAADRLLGKKGTEGLVPSIAKVAGVPENQLFNNYFPGILDEVFRKSVKTKRKGGLFKTTARLKKEFKDDVLVKDAMIAFQKKFFELARVGMHRRIMIKAVKQFGKQFPGKSEKEIAELGFKEFFPERTLKEVAETDITLKPILEEGSKVFFPERSARVLEDFFKTQTMPRSAMGKIIDAWTQHFKAFVLARPAYHFRNFAISNQMQGYLAFGPKWFTRLSADRKAVMILENNAKKGQTFINVKSTGAKLSLSKVETLAKREGITTVDQFLADLGGREYASRSPEVLKGRWQDWVNLNAERNTIVRGSRTAGQLLESQSRLKGFMIALEDGMGPEAARKMVNNAFFDYGAMTPFGRKFMRRAFTFYKFDVANANLQLNTFIKNPSRQGIPIKLINTLSNDTLRVLSEEDPSGALLEQFNEFRTRIQENGFAIPMGVDNDGNVMWATGLDFPQAAFIKLFDKRNLFFKLNPAGKLAGNMFFETELEKLFTNTKITPLKGEYEIDELNFLLKDAWDDPEAAKALREAINNPTPLTVENLMKNPTIAGHNLVNLLGLHIGQKTIFEKGQPRSVPVIKSNAKLLNAMRNSFIAAHLAIFRNFGRPQNTAANGTMKLITGMGIFSQELIAQRAIESSRVAREAEDALARDGIRFVSPGIPENVSANARAVERMTKRFRREF